MRVLVVGATGGSGRATVNALLSAGHEVTAFARRPEALGVTAERLKVFQGDAMKPGDVERAVQGQDAVIVTLGITENALLVRLRGSAGTPLDVRSAGTRNVIAAMRKHGVRKLVVQTTYGVGETKGRLPLSWKLIFALLLQPQIRDTERQEREVRESGLDWVLAQPVGLTDDAKEEVFPSPVGEARGMSVSRRSVGRFLVEAAESARYIGRSVALSAA
ncbi:NAD(P)H-binding protein [Pyxidicoccus fallax]|uniref:NAD(P)H-binding protein n=1 Tax=Pyxidicoccus fallax TaxID=394095 RepID=A0A848LE10_9BACT|nr:NAD(P)H-binding protein [Pyxidicoccus fallax]NMO13678.1 NAD(P)H-binding protein [Pyxidicoccus fallax]NPC76834.1 NAD(P)H-binding protein [Pyxidicoccus fallax]